MSDEKPKNPVEKPMKGSRTRNLRGGNWYYGPFSLESAYRRNGSRPSSRYGDSGFRIARTAKK